MKKMLHAATAVFLLFESLPIIASESDRVLEKVDQFVDAYMHNDVERVVAMADEDEFTVYGSDVAEYFSGRESLRAMMSDDFQLWKTAQVGALRDVSVRVSRDLATVMFQAPFSAGGRPEMLVRFITVWRRHGRDWYLTQSSNSVPTVGSSAAEILKSVASPKGQ
jgi:ketosteroid isomerase-like protein